MRQLTTLDAQFLAVESARTYGHVGGLAIYDPSTAPGGELTSRTSAGSSASACTCCRRSAGGSRACRSGSTCPYWVEDPDFDLDFHIRESAVPPPGDDRQLAETVARIFARPLDRGRPLWEIYLSTACPAATSRC